MGTELFERLVIEGRYTLVRELGSGGFGEVWLARDERLHRDVALKVMRAALASNTALRKRFEREGPLLAQLDHPNVVRVYDRGSWEGRAFVALEYVDGGTLADWLDGHRKLRRGTSATEVRELFLQVCAGVAAAHAKGIVHRDLKPENVLLKHGGSGEVIAKVLDFGLARAEGQASSVAAKVGTWAYMSPEQASEGSDELGPASDVFSLGVVLIELLTGRVLPQEGSKVSWERLAERGQAMSALQSLSGLRDDVPAATWSVVATCLASDPRGRPVTAGALRQALLAAWQQSQPIPVAAPVPAARTPMGSIAPFGSMVQPTASPPPAPIAPPVGSPPAETPPWTSGPSREAPVSAPRASTGMLGWAAGAGLVLVLGVATYALWPHAPAASRRTDARSSNTSPAADAGSASASPMLPALPRCPADMALIPAGDFLMGTPNGEEGSQDDEHPQHRVHSNAFCMDRTEVTVAAYRRCVDAGGCSQQPNAYRDARGSNEQLCNWGRPGYEAHPVNCVDWNQARAYCGWTVLVGGARRLPTEAEWEYAARGTSGRRYAWGTTLEAGRANFCGTECVAALTAIGLSDWTAFPNWTDAFGFTAPADSLAAGATPEGLLHMTGNVWEWVEDVYNRGAYATRGEGFNARVAVTQTDSAYSDYRVLRGGGWGHNEPSRVRAADRNGVARSIRNSNVGFRCARDPQ